MADSDIEMPRGSTRPAIWQFMQDESTPFSLSGSTLLLNIVWRKGSIKKSSADGGLVIDIATGKVTWTPTTAESRSIPTGRFAKYEIERRVGATQEPLVSGYFVGVGGLNDD